MDHFDHGVELLQDFGIPKAKDVVSLTFEELGPSQILLGRRGMLTSIEFDNQVTLYTTEIGNEWWDRVLPAKFDAFHLPAT